MTDFFRPTFRTSIFRVIGWMTFGLASSSFASFFAFGKSVTEKFVTALVLPCGVIWLLIFAMSLLAFFLKSRAVGCLGLLTFAIYTVLGSGYLSSALAAAIEAPFQDIDPLQQEPFDEVVVLGGGGKVGSNLRSQGNGSGDRLILAAALYHGGITKTVICTGTSIKGLGNDKIGPGEISAAVLQSLGVPDDAIELVEGRTTSEEMTNLSQRFGKDGRRVGVVTSAWHLSRALRLAESHDLNFYPLPADFLGGPIRPRSTVEMVKDCIPDIDRLIVTSHVLREYLAALAGR